MIRIEDFKVGDKVTIKDSWQCFGNFPKKDIITEVGKDYVTAGDGFQYYVDPRCEFCLVAFDKYYLFKCPKDATMHKKKERAIQKIRNALYNQREFSKIPFSEIQKIIEIIGTADICTD